MATDREEWRVTKTLSTNGGPHTFIQSWGLLTTRERIIDAIRKSAAAVDRSACLVVIDCEALTLELHTTGYVTRYTLEPHAD
jgi:hypothetical protein